MHQNCGGIKIFGSRLSCGQHSYPKRAMPMPDKAENAFLYFQYLLTKTLPQACAFITTDPQTHLSNLYQLFNGLAFVIFTFSLRQPWWPNFFTNSYRKAFFGTTSSNFDLITWKGCIYGVRSRSSPHSVDKLFIRYRSCEISATPQSVAEGATWQRKIPVFSKFGSY